MEFFNKKLNAYKANLHTHSTNSDGEFSPEKVIDLYANANYDVLAFSDHRKPNPVSTYDPMGMTLISGIELHPAGPREINWHILGLGVPEDFADCYPESGQAAVDAIIRSGGIAFAAHPYWCGFTSAEVMSLQNLTGIEVYNTSCRYIGKEYNMTHWDEMLDAGYRVSALAVDDVHHPCDLFRGFTMILAENKSPEALLAALKAGQFYSSQGPVIERLSLENGILSADFSPCVAVTGCMRRSRGLRVMVEDQNGPGSGNQELTHAEFDVSSLHDNYVRLQLRAADGKMAWSNPIFIN